MSEGPEGSYALHNLLTNLATRVGALEGSMKTFMDNWARQDQLAHDARRTLYERVDLLSRQIERVATDVHNVQQDVAELKKEVEETVMPVVDATVAQRERRTGAKGVWILIGSGVMMAISAVTYVVDKALQFFTHKP